MIAEVNGIRLYYEKTGQGRPLVMVHGNGEDHTSWLWFLLRFLELILPQVLIFLH